MQLTDEDLIKEARMIALQEARARMQGTRGDYSTDEEFKEAFEAECERLFEEEKERFFEDP